MSGVAAGPCFNPIPTGLGHVTLIYGLIPPMAGRNRVKLGIGTAGSPCISQFLIPSGYPEVRGSFLSIFLESFDMSRLK